MFEQFGFEETTARQVSVLLALGLGLVFGILGERTGFCFRSAIVGENRKQALGVWMMALAVAVIGTQASVAGGLISFEDHRFQSADVAWLAIVLGGLIFGTGMVLTRGCVSRLTVLGGGGNLRALTVLLVFAVVAHATLKGGLATMRTSLAQVTAPIGDFASLAALPGGATLWAGALALAALAIALRSGNRPGALAMAALIGLLVPAAWVGTGYVLFDEFDPITLESLSFTAPLTESLFWTIAGTAIEPGFGVGLFGGVLAGGLVSALAFNTFKWQSFSSPRETGRYLLGAVLMGVGGVLAGGCTVGAGLSGIPTLSTSAVLALAAIALGAKSADWVLSASPQGAFSSGAEATRPQSQPAA